MKGHERFHRLEQAMPEATITTETRNNLGIITGSSQMRV